MGIVLDRDSSVPLYLQLSEGFVGEIQAGSMPLNAMIPPERTLMKEHDVSRATVRQALDRLAALGYLRKEHGRGNFISMPGASSSPGSFYDFAEEMQAVGQTGKTEIVFFRIVQCYPDLASILGLTSKDYVYKFIRLHFADNVPVLLETTYLPYAIFESLSRGDLQKASLKEIITVWFRKAITQTEESFGLVVLESGQASLLGAATGESALQRHRVSFCNDQAIEYTISLAVSKGIVFRTVARHT